MHKIEKPLSMTETKPGDVLYTGRDVLYTFRLFVYSPSFCTPNNNNRFGVLQTFRRFVYYPSPFYI